MPVHTKTIQLNTNGNADIRDITEAVEQVVRSTGLADGSALVFCSSSTSAVTTIEFEAGALADLRRLFDQIVDPRQPYQHNATWGDGNGHSHVRAALLGPSLSIPFVNGRLALGTWQQIIYVDFDNRPRHRELVVQVMGE